MTVNATWVFRSASVGFLALLSACVESDTGERDAQPAESSSDGGLDDAGDGPDGPNPPDLDGGDSGPSLDGGPDAGPNPPQSDAEVDAGGCGGTGLTCSGDTPVCAAGVCVECTSEDDGQCGETERCNPATNRCDIENHPFALDCANLPSEGACEGGPREVVLAMHKEGAIAMLDPEDGHFLGYFKANHDDNEGGIYYQATQGPDQCIWTVHSGRAVERWDTDGKYKDNIIPTKKHYVTDPTHGSQDVIDAPHSIAFTADRAFVASTAGTPHARVSSFALDGSFDEVVSDDGRRVHSLLALGDGSLVVASNLVTLPGSPRRVDLLPADGSAPVPLVTDATDLGQVAYAGDGSIVAVDSADGHLYRARLAGGGADKFVPVPAQTFVGVTPLHNGKWQVAGSGTGLGTVDPTSVNPVAAWQRTWDDKAFARPRDYMFLGRACLPTAFVEERAPEPPVASCDAPEGTALYSEDFETGDFTGTGDERHFNDVYELPLDNVTVSIDPDLGAEQSARSLHILGAPADENGDLILAHEAPPSGVNVRAFSSDKPAYVSYSFRVELEDAWAAHFILNSRFENVLDGVYVSSSEEDGLYLSTYHSNLIVPITENEWHQVQLRIDWDRRMYDLYVDCERVADDILFPIGGANDLDTIELRNYWPTDGSWFDEIVVK